MVNKEQVDDLSSRLPRTICSALCWLVEQFFSFDTNITGFLFPDMRAIVLDKSSCAETKSAVYT